MRRTSWLGTFHRRESLCPQAPKFRGLGDAAPARRRRARLERIPYAAASSLGAPGPGPARICEWTAQLFAAHRSEGCYGPTDVVQ